MRNQYMAQVLVHNKVVTEDQVKAHWGEITESMDIGQVLVKAGILQQAMYAKVLAFVQNLEAKHAAANAAAQPAQVQPTAPAPKPAPAAVPAPKPSPVEAKPAVAEPVDDEPALQIEGNNIYGESSSSNMVVEKVSGLETTSISTISIAEETGEDSAEEGEQELPRQFALSSGEGTAVEAPQTLLPIMSLKKMIAFARQYGATDIYLYSNRQVVMRQSGALFPATEQVVDKTRISELLAEASEGFADGYQVVAGKNFSRTIALAGVGRARISVTWNGVVPSVSIRVIPTEAAALDGASALTTFFRIKVPYLSSTILFVTILSVINSFKVFREVYLLTGDYPYDSLYLLQHFMNNMFKSLDYQKLSSAAILMGIVMVLIIGLLFWIDRKLGKDIEE